MKIIKVEECRFCYKWVTQKCLINGEWLTCPKTGIREDCPLPDSPVEISREQAEKMAKSLNEYAPNFEHVFVDGFMACFDRANATGWIPVSGYPFVKWLSCHYQLFCDKFIKLTGNGRYENPYETTQPFLTWEEVLKDWESTGKHLPEPPKEN